jgi:hypothetical protein
MKKHVFSMIVLLLCIFGVAAATAETLRVRVIDRDLGIALEGVEVRETSTGTVARTDERGAADLEIRVPAGGRAVLLATLLGYEPARVLVRDFSEAMEIKMVLEGILEAAELLVEEAALGKSDEQVGVSVAVERDTIKSSAVIGVIEDLMSTVRILPGVTYSGAFEPNLSVRGGEPDGLTHVLDGFVIKYPYHWGGGVSIFNPRLVDSLKLSAGIFPVRYGQATSGLLEITSVVPNDGLKWEVGTSVSTLEGIVQVPFGQGGQNGILAGARLTNYDLVFALTGNFLEDQGVTFSRVPYIYDFYLKLFLRPRKNFEWYINGFTGTDGIGIRALDPDVDMTKEISDTFDFVWTNRDTFINAGLKWLPGDRLFLNVLGGYENWTAAADGSFVEKGTRAYSDEFIERFGPGLGLSGGDTFPVDIESDFRSETTLHHFQLRGDADYVLRDYLTLQGGAGFFLAMFRYDTTGAFWNIGYDEDGTPVYRRTVFSSSAEDNDILTTFFYLNAATVIFPDLLSGDFGLRIDHGYYWGKDGYTLNTYPVLGPRALLRLTPPVKGDFLESMTLSLGSGLFSKVPFDSLLITEDMGLDDFDVKVPKTVMTVLGWEGRFPLGWRFKIEGYYKYIYDRFYYNLVVSDFQGNTETRDIRVHNDGTGHAGGFDFLLDRRTSRFFDGMLSYSFIWARYNNPKSDGTEGLFAEEPRERWYYPTFHRFHSLNLLVNVKPKPWFTLTSKLSFATGTPLPRYGDREMFFARIENRDGAQAIAEMYSRREFYDDYRRRGWVLPLDIKASFHWYRKNSKVYNELYIGAQDILSPLLAAIGPASGAVQTDRYTGEDTRAPESSFSFPVISLGYRASY